MPESSALHSCRRIAVAGIVLASVAAAVQTVLYLLDVYALDRSVATFDVDEGALSTWASSSATFAVGLVAVLLYFVDPREGLRGPALGLAAAYLSFDDAATVHETIASKVTSALDISESYAQVAWPALYFPLLTIVAVLLLRVGRESAVAHRLIVSGLALLAVGVVMEMTGVVLDHVEVDKSSWLWTLEFTIEEGVELAGWILIASGVSARLVTVALDSGQVSGRTRHPSSGIGPTARDTAEALRREPEMARHARDR